MANIICFKQEKGLKKFSNRQLKVTANHKIYPESQKTRISKIEGVGGGTLSDVLRRRIYPRFSTLTCYV